MNKLLPLFLLFTSSIYADTIVLTTGETLQVEVVKQGEEEIVVVHKLLGEMTISLQNIDTVTIDQPPAQTSNPQASQKQDALPQETEPALEPVWNQRITLGFGYQQSQHNNVDLNTAYHAEKVEENQTISFDVSYRFSESDDTRTTNWLASSLSNTWHSNAQSWDVFTTFKFDWSEFQSWDQRVIADAGFEINLLNWETEQHIASLKARVGAGIRQEFESINEELIPEGLLGLKFDWKLGNEQTFHADTTWFPDFNNTDNYRVVTNAAWSIQLDSIENLSFSIGLHHEFDSVVAADVKNDFLHLTAGIEYAF